MDDIPFTRQRVIATGVHFSTRNAPEEGVTEVLDGHEAVDCYGHPLPAKFPAQPRRVSESTEADEAYIEASEEAYHGIED